MSGPKPGTYRNYEAEARILREQLKNTLKFLEKESENIEKFLKHANEALNFIKKFITHPETERKIRNIVKDLQNFKKFLQNKKKILSLPIQNTPAYVEKLQKELNDLPKKIPAENKLQDLKQTLEKETKNSYEIKQKLLKEMREEAKNIYNSEIEFIKDWASDDKLIQEIDNLYSSIQNSDYDEVKNIFPKFKDLILKAKEIAQNNYNELLIKKETSDEILNVLQEMGFENIERKLDGDNIIVSAETPLGDWELDFILENENKLIIKTPEDNRCFVNLPNIIEKLKEKGIDIKIKKLEDYQSNKKNISSQISKKEKGRF